MEFAVSLMMVNNAAALVAAVEGTCRNTQDADWVETKHVVVVVAVAIDVDNDNHRSQTSTVVVVVVAFLVHEILNDLLNEGNTVDTLDCMDKGGPAQTPFDAADADLLVLEMT
jgi:hypothetical protein